MNISSPGRRAMVWLGLLAWLGLAESVGWGQPANDNFANAWTIAGSSGTTNGSNVGATLEAGEPDIFGVSVGESVWYKWTAPADGTYIFDTIGSGFDSLLGIYTGNAVDALTVVGEGYYLISLGGAFSSPVSFIATAGTAYSIKVDGYAFGGLPEGTVALNWNTNTSPSAAGDFLFASQATVPRSLMPLYIASESESFSPADPRGMMHAAGEDTGEYGARLTVTRLIGATGRVLVDYTITNSFYTNIFTTNIFGTNFFTTNLTAGSYTNTFTTNILVTGRYQNNEYGLYVHITNYTLTTFAGSNLTGFPPGMTVSNYPPTNIPPVEFDCLNSLNFSTVTDTNTTPPTVYVYYTNIFCITTNATNIVASATPYLDYTPTSGRLIFNDYQMSADIQVPIFPSFGRQFPILNRVLIASITNVALDPLESTAIPPPTASTAATNAMLNILSQMAMVVPFEKNPNSGPSGTGTGMAGTNVFNFERATLRCTENVNGSGVAYVGVLRSSVDYSQATEVNYRIDYIYPCGLGNNMFENPTDWEIPLQAGSDYAGFVTKDCAGTYSDNLHFTTVSGTLNWGAYDAGTKFIQIPISDDNVVQFNEDLLVQLYLPGPKYPNAGSERSLGYVQTCNLTILFDDQPAGAADRSYNPNGNPDTHPAYNQFPGPNNPVYAIAIQADGRAIIGGDFTDYNGIGVVNNEANIYRLARVNTDGSLDQSFNPGYGVEKSVNALALDALSRVVLGGAFTSVDGTERNRIARVGVDGSLDNNFGLDQAGADGTVWALAIDPVSGNILMAGNFTNVNTFPRHFIARLLPDGTTDTTFDPGVGPDGTIWAVAVQGDGRIIIGGSFTHVDGVALNHIARLNADGTLDSSFDPAAGFDADVYALALQPDGKVVVGGAFHSFNAYTRNGLTRLDSSGALDQSFITGTGTDDTVYCVRLQPDNKILLSGIFTRYNETRRMGIARVLSSGTLDTSFMDTAYNQYAGVVGQYWDPAAEATHFIWTMGLQPDGNILIAGSFPRIGGGGARDSVPTKQNFTRLIGGATPGPGNIEFMYKNYSQDQTHGDLFINLTRTNGHLGPASVAVTPVTFGEGAGNAVEDVDFAFDAATYGAPTWITTYPVTWHMQDGTYSQNNGYSLGVEPNHGYNYPDNDVWVSLIDNTNAAGNRALSLELHNPTDNDNFLLGGQRIPLGVALGRASAPVTIINPHTLPGVLGFSSPTFTSMESTNATITITRTNGNTGTVSVWFQTLNGTATNLLNYRSNYSRVDFPAGITLKTVVVTNINDTTRQGDHTVNLRLLNPSGGATLGLSNAVLTLIDNDIPGGYVEFSSPSYSTNENAGTAYVTITRNGSSAGTLSVQFSTTNGTARSGVNYVGMTNITYTWNNGDIAPKVIAIPILDDGLVETNALTINLQLRSATLNGTNSAAALIGTINAVLSIANSDFRGQVAFSTDNYSVNENGGPGYITVVRTGGSAESLTVNFATLPGTSTPGVDFYPTNGTLLFGPGEVSKTFTVPIIDNAQEDLRRFVTLVLSNAAPADALGYPSTAILTIVDDETYNEPPGSLDTAEDPSAGVNGPVYAMTLQDDGKLLVGGDFTMANGLSRRRMARLNTDGSLDQTFSSTSPIAGANASVLALVSQTDGRIVLGGTFTNVNGTHRNYLTRLALNGALDTTFNLVGSGPNNPVFAVAEAFNGSDRKLLVGGSFTSFNSAARNFITRLNDNGSLDTEFQVGLGADGNVFGLAVQADGKVVIGGDFTTVNGVARPHVARLNIDGSVDQTFDPGTGAGDSVRAVAVQLDGRILIGGLFTNVNGTALNHIARLTAGGAVDATFTPGLGFNDLVSTIAIQPDTRIVLGGQFTLCNGVTRHRLTRLNNDGTLDTMINFGTGADSFVAALAIQTNGMINLGGGFTSYDDQARQHLARIYGGTVGGSGTLEFSAASYQVLETATNAILTVRRRGGTSGVMSNNVYVPNVTIGYATDPRGSTAVVGTNYLGVTNTLTFPPGELFQNVTIPVMHDWAITPDLVVSNYLSNPMPAVPGGPGMGNQPSALLSIVNVDSGISFSAATYFFTEDSGYALIPVLRTGSSVGSSSVDFLTTTNGTAFAYTNYLPVTNTITFADGQTSNNVQVPLIHYTGPQGDATVGLQLTNVSGSLLLNPFDAVLTIVNVDNMPGQLLFSQTNYVVNEGAGFLPVTIIRTNGQAGTIQVNFSTVAGTALPGFKYLTTNGVLTFGPGQTSQTFTVPILPENQVEGNQTFSIVLSNATAGATLVGPTSVLVTIIDDDVGVSFASPVYVVSESSDNVSLTLYRQNGTNGVTTVNYTTTNYTAQAGINYVGVTNGTVTFNRGDVFKSIVLGVLHDPRVTGDVSLGVNLSNPSAPAQLGTPSSALVVVQDIEAGLSIDSTNLVAVTNVDTSVTTNASFGLMKSGGTNLLVTIVRSNVNTGTLGVNYATADGTALAGVDYVAKSGALTFSNGIAFRTVELQVISNRFIEGDRTFTFYLTNATPTNVASLLTPYTATVTITDDISGLSFSSPAYSANENGQQAVITVLRSSYTNSAVSVDFSTSDGTGQAGVNYFRTNGTLFFTNGETAKTFSVGLIDNHVIDGGHTVLLNLTNATGNAVLINPANATLMIAETDGSMVVPAGVALTSESGPVNGVIDAGERVTLLFGLRNAGGTNTVSLVATLLATNGITNPSGQQNYGVLTAHGPSASRSFAFTASGTNGQTIAATLQLRDGSVVLSNAVYSFTLGKAPASYSNSTTIVINDHTNATPYPSVITVSNLNGLVTQATVTLTNLNHLNPRDIDALLVSPTGQKTLLMAHCGSTYAINNATITFDDTTNNVLPQFALITNGTYHPTSYAITPPQFPVPPAPFATNATAPPFATNLSVFNGTSPNGDWALYFYDDNSLFAGNIANGWMLNLSLTGPVPGAADLALGMTASASSVVATSNLTYTVSVTNYGPSSATNVVVTDILPGGAVLASNAPTQGSVTNTAGVVTWNVGSLATNATARLTLVIQPATAGTITNSATVTTATADPNPDDDSASVVTTVITPTADLALGMASSPNPVFTGYNLTYTLTVTNLGLATAPGLVVVDTLPPTVTFVSAWPSNNYSVVGRVVTFLNLGNVGSNQQVTAMIVVKPTVGGTLTNTATCSSAVTDPFKANNNAAVKTVVNPFQLGYSHGGSSLTLSWPADAANTYLEATTNLRPPVIWGPATNPPPSVVNGQKTVTLPIGSGAKFFRVHGTTP